MKINHRIFILKKIEKSIKLAQQASVSTPVNAQKVQPAAQNLSEYYEKLSTIIPGLNVRLVSPQDFMFLSRIIGIIDQSLNILSNQTLSFYSVTTSNPSVSSAGFQNHDQLTALIRMAQLLKSKLTTQRIMSGQDKINEFINPIDSFSNLIQIGSTPSTLSSKIQGSPQDAIKRELANWKSIIKI